MRQCYSKRCNEKVIIALLILLKEVFSRPAEISLDSALYPFLKEKSKKHFYYESHRTT